jgi:hypothetical protein
MSRHRQVYSSSYLTPATSLKTEKSQQANRDLLSDSFLLVTPAIP